MQRTVRKTAGGKTKSDAAPKEKNSVEQALAFIESVDARAKSSSPKKRKLTPTDEEDDFDPAAAKTLADERAQTDKLLMAYAKKKENELLKTEEYKKKLNILKSKRHDLSPTEAAERKKAIDRKLKSIKKVLEAVKNLVTERHAEILAETVNQMAQEAQEAKKRKLDELDELGVSSDEDYDGPGIRERILRSIEDAELEEEDDDDESIDYAAMVDNKIAVNLDVSPEPNR